MKKFLVLFLILSLMMLCACRGSVQVDLPDDATDSNVSDAGSADSTENVTIDWETPIDVDDSFLEETEVEDNTSEAETTDSESEEEPTASTPTSSQNTPTQPNPTESDPTEGATEPTETTKPIGSGPIELPMIPG